MGLLDFNNPEVLQALQLISAKKGDLTGLLGQFGQQNEQRKQRQLQEELHRQQMEAQRMQMEQQRRVMGREDQMDALAKRAYAPNQNLVHGDDEGFAMPSSGGGGDAEFAQGIMGINPMQGFGIRSQLAQLNQKAQPKYHVVNGALVPEPSAPGQQSQPVYTAPEKPEVTKKGSIREIKSGGQLLTYEWNGQKWEKIASAPQFKPDGPEKPEKAPQGYRYTDGGGRLEPIPGGPADQKVGAQAEALQKRTQGALERADMVLGNVREAISETGVTTAGPLGAIGRKIPGTGAYNLNKKLDTIRANIGFAELQAMREASPTGGALGQVAVQELNMLQSVLGSLDTAQTPAQLEKTLYSIEKHYTNWKQAVKGAQTKGPQRGGVVDWNDLP